MRTANRLDGAVTPHAALRVLHARKAFGDQMRNLARRKAPLAEGGTWPADATTGPKGGYLVPSELALRIEFILRERSTFYRFATRQPMTSATCRVPVLDTAAGRFAGLALQWVDEAALKPESEPSWVTRTLIAHDLVASVVASDNLVADGGEALGTFLETLFAAAIEWGVDDACFNGPVAGTDRPSGVLNAPACLTATTPALMLEKLLPESYPNAIWSAHPTAIADLAAATTYRPAVDAALPALAGILYGRPVIATAHLPPDGLLLWDPTLYVLGWRYYEILASPHPLFTSNQTVFRLVWRGDGGPRLAAAFSGMSAYVTLSGVTMLQNRKARVERKKREKQEKQEKANEEAIARELKELEEWERKYEEAAARERAMKGT